MVNRAARRGVGKRKAYRSAKAAIKQVLELYSRGYSPKTIAAITGVTLELVNDVINAARKVDEGGG